MLSDLCPFHEQGVSAVIGEFSLLEVVLHQRAVPTDIKHHMVKLWTSSGDRRLQQRDCNKVLCKIALGTTTTHDKTLSGFKLQTSSFFFLSASAFSFQVPPLPSM